MLAPLPERLKPCQLPNDEKSHCPSPGGLIRLQGEVTKSLERSIQTSKSGEHKWNQGVGQLQMEQSPRGEPHRAGERRDPRKMEARQRKMKEESGASPSAAESAAEPGWM